MFVEGVVGYQVEVTAKSCSSVQRVLPAVVCRIDTSRMRRSWPALGHKATTKCM